MSMLSKQIERLRSCADLYDGTTKPELDKGLQRPYLAKELREAADIICQLRDKSDRLSKELQRMGNQYAKVAGLNAVIHRQRKQLTDVQEAIARRNSENAKLRNLCVDMASHLREAERIHGGELLPDVYITRMQELGVEVS